MKALLRFQPVLQVKYLKASLTAIMTKQERKCMNTAIYCIDLCSYINSFSPWKREKLWKKDYETFVVTNIVEVINEKIKKFNDKYLTND